MNKIDLSGPPDGLLRATIFLPIKDDIGIPEGKYLLIGDKEYPELENKPIIVGESVIEGTEGRTPMSIRIWRIESDHAPNRRLVAAEQALRRSGWILENADQEARETGDQAHEIDDPASELTDTHVVIEVTTIIEARGGMLIGDAFAKPIEIVRRLQTSLLTIGHDVTLELLTREQLPRLVDIIISPGPPASDNGPGTRVLMTTQPFPSSRALGVASMLDQQQLEQLLFQTGFLPWVGSLSYFEFRNDAMVQLHRYGNYRQSIIASAASGESIVNTIIELLLWEEGQSAQEAAATIGTRDGILSRAKRQVSGRIGGEWDHTRPGPVQDWFEKLLKVRNIIIHGAHEATRQQALDAIAALDGLVAFLGDRLSAPNTIRDRPRTVILSFGKPSLGKRGRWSKRLENLSNEHEPTWRFEFTEWRLQLVEHLGV